MFKKNKYFFDGISAVMMITYVLYSNSINKTDHYYSLIFAVIIISITLLDKLNSLNIYLEKIILPLAALIVFVNLNEFKIKLNMHNQKDLIIPISSLILFTLTIVWILADKRKETSKKVENDYLRSFIFSIILICTSYIVIRIITTDVYEGNNVNDIKDLLKFAKTAIIMYIFSEFYKKSNYKKRHSLAFVMTIVTGIIIKTWINMH